LPLPEIDQTVQNILITSDWPYLAIQNCIIYILQFWNDFFFFSRVLLIIMPIWYLGKLMCSSGRAVMFCRHFVFMHVCRSLGLKMVLSIYILFVFDIRPWILLINRCCMTVHIIYLLSTQQSKKVDQPSPSSTRSEICKTTCTFSWNTLTLDLVSV
jgi:hypothetical protein